MLMLPRLPTTIIVIKTKRFFFAKKLKFSTVQATIQLAKGQSISVKDYQLLFKVTVQLTKKTINYCQLLFKATVHLTERTFSAIKHYHLLFSGSKIADKLLFIQSKDSPTVLYFGYI